MMPPDAAVRPAAPIGAIQIASYRLGQIEQVMAKIGGGLVFLLMLIVVTDITRRYFLNKPFDWSLDLISLYLMAALFYLPLSATYQDNSHIAVDILQPYLPPRVRRRFQTVIGVLSCGLFSAISWGFIGRTLEDWDSGAAQAGDYAWPSWASDIIVPIGAGVLALRCLLHAIGNLAGLLGAEHTIPLPPTLVKATLAEADAG